LRNLFSLLLVVITVPLIATSLWAEDMQLQLRSLRETKTGSGTFERQTQSQTWSPKETAVVVCDVWDLHHCLNAVRRLEEFAPRLDAVLKTAREKGATIIHSPSDCMPAYVDHPARRRAQAVPQAATLPRDIAAWCSKIPAEEQTVYPIDQSDGGEDDDPAEHAEWAAKLKAQGRNPGMPWKKQSDLITIDGERDFISDKGDEVWNILQQRGIKHVILTGVHTNMCVLGRPFGLRQMARNGMQVVLMRDMTDCMYNPKRWPYVDHFTGNDLIIAHVERFVCPTITSDQILGGQSFRSKRDTREKSDVLSVTAQSSIDATTFNKQWSLATFPSSWNAATNGTLSTYEGVAWYRCAVRLPADWIGTAGGVTLTQQSSDSEVKVWLNGHLLKASSESTKLVVPREWIEVDDANLLVMRTVARAGQKALADVPTVEAAGGKMKLNGRWQFRLGDDPSWSNIPLPARYGASPDIVFEPARR
jgi:nicotinamidase-related amidase